MSTFRAIIAAVTASCAAAAFSLSATLGNHMVLQRDSAATTVWGFATAGSTVKTIFNSNSYLAATGSDGIWRQKLPATPAGGPYSLTFSASTGEAASLSDVLFGDVFLCGGQSNMQFTVTSGVNATAEIQAANNYPNIRVFTVGQGTTSYTPLNNLATVSQPWVLASNTSIGAGNWTEFSAVCWFFGRDLYDSLGGAVPIGLISNNWGGTRDEAWSSPTALKVCNASVEDISSTDVQPYEADEYMHMPTGGPGSNNASVLWNAMIVPYTVGPMALSGFTWFQGEQNAGNYVSYQCTFPAMIADWRTNFANPTAWFGFVQLEPWIGAPSDLPEFRDAQLLALKQPNVAVATAIDIGDPLGPFGSVHPRHKQVIGFRLSSAIQSMSYGQNVPYLNPTFASSVGSANGNTLSVTVAFNNVGAGSLNFQAAHCPTEIGVPIAQCAWWSVIGSDGSAYNATAAITANGQGVTLSATAKAGVTPVASAYGYGIWPVITLYNAAGFPVLPWYRNVTA